MLFAEADPTAFYAAFAPLCFTLLGLWLIVVQTRFSEWRSSPVHRTRAYVLAVNLALPGMMTLLSLANPGNDSLWRVGFALVGAIGVLILSWLALAGPGRGRHSPASVLGTWITVALYIAVIVLAIAPQIVNDANGTLTALQVEEIVLSVLVFVAITVASFLMFDSPDDDDGRPRD